MKHDRQYGGRNQWNNFKLKMEQFHSIFFLVLKEGMNEGIPVALDNRTFEAFRKGNLRYTYENKSRILLQCRYHVTTHLNLEKRKRVLSRNLRFETDSMKWNFSRWHPSNRIIYGKCLLIDIACGFLKRYLWFKYLLCQLHSIDFFHTLWQD